MLPCNIQGNTATILTANLTTCVGFAVTWLSTFALLQFQVLFHPFINELFTFPSRYSSAIGPQRNNYRWKKVISDIHFTQTSNASLLKRFYSAESMHALDFHHLWSLSGNAVQASIEHSLTYEFPSILQFECLYSTRFKAGLVLCSLAATRRFLFSFISSAY